MAFCNEAATAPAISSVFASRTFKAISIAAICSLESSPWMTALKSAVLSELKVNVRYKVVLIIGCVA